MPEGHAIARGIVESIQELLIETGSAYVPGLGTFVARHKTRQGNNWFGYKPRPNRIPYAVKLYMEPEAYKKVRDASIKRAEEAIAQGLPIPPPRWRIPISSISPRARRLRLRAMRLAQAVEQTG